MKTIVKCHVQACVCMHAYVDMHACACMRARVCVYVRMHAAQVQQQQQTAIFFYHTI